jgi:hypothetical protein
MTENLAHRKKFGAIKYVNKRFNLKREKIQVHIAGQSQIHALMVGRASAALNVMVFAERIKSC